MLVLLGPFNELLDVTDVGTKRCFRAVLRLKGRYKALKEPGALGPCCFL